MKTNCNNVNQTELIKQWLQELTNLTSDQIETVVNTMQKQRS